MKNVYKCGICGVEYSDVKSRMNCEMKCIKKQQEEEKAAAEAKLKAEKDTRRKEVTEAVDKAVELITKYNEDYEESFIYTTNSDSTHNTWDKHRAFSRSCFWL